MKNYKTINKQPDIDIFQIKKIKLFIEGKIIYMTCSESNNIFIITDNDLFYVIEEGKEKYTNNYKLYPRNKEFKNQKLLKDSHIWHDKLSTHIIIKHKSNVYYYNPYILKEKFREINFTYKNKNIQPYAIAFNNNFYDIFNTGDILLSDYNSNIYNLCIELNDRNKIITDLRLIFSLKPEKNFICHHYINSDGDEEEENEDDFDDLELFKLDKDERILDMKIFYSFENRNSMHGNQNREGINILILVITKNSLFQFYGKESFEKVFKKYSVRKGDILKAYKNFHYNKKFNLNKSRIQLFNQYVPFYNYDQFKRPELLFSCMFPCGYYIGKIDNSAKLVPQNGCIIYNYVKPKEKYLFPIMVCQSIIHIFYLYDDCLLIQNKLTYRICNIIYLKEKYIDIFYNQVMNGIILYSSSNIYKISLDLESRYLWEFYVEIGQYEFSLQALSYEDQYMAPILRKLYADSLFNQKKYNEAADNYAYSDEKFEHVCLRFLKINNIQSLLRYFAIIFYLKYEKNDKNIINDNLNEKDKGNKNNFIEKYLLNTWIFEILIILKYKNKNNKIIPFIREYSRSLSHGINYIDKSSLYFLFKYCNKSNELIEFAQINQEYDKAILELIIHGKIKEALDCIKEYFYFGIQNSNKIIKEILFRYAYLFINLNPKIMIFIFQKFLDSSKDIKKIKKVLLYYNKSNNISNEENLKKISNYIISLIQKNSKTNCEEINLIQSKSLYNYLILSSSINNQNDLIIFLKSLIKENPKEIFFDLNLSQIILKNNYTCLALIYYLFHKYNKCVYLCLDNNSYDIIKFLIKNTDNDNIKNEIVINIIDYQRKKGKFKSIQIIGNNGQILIIDEFTLKITANFKIKILNDNQLDLFINLLLDDKPKIISDSNNAENNNFKKKSI